MMRLLGRLRLRDFRSPAATATVTTIPFLLGVLGGAALGGNLMKCNATIDKTECSEGIGPTDKKCCYKGENDIYEEHTASVKIWWKGVNGYYELKDKPTLLGGDCTPTRTECPPDC